MGDFVRNRLPKLFRRHSSGANTRPALSNPVHLDPHNHDLRDCARPHRLQTVVDVDAVGASGNPAVQAQQLLHDTPLRRPNQPPPPIVTLEAPSPPPPAPATVSCLAATIQQSSFQNAPPTPAVSLSTDGLSSLDPPSDQPQESLLSTPNSIRPGSHPPEVIGDYFPHVADDVEEPVMSRRKIWVRRPGASPTLVQIAQDDMVDDVRDMVLRKYGNSLGRTFDAPDVVIRIVPRERSQQATERVLSPEETMCRVLDAYYPGGQTVDEALLVEVPQRRTPRPSPRADHAATYFSDLNHRPAENEGDYFPPMPPAQSPRPQPPTLIPEQIRPSINNFHPAHSATSLEGPLPPLPSPRERKERRPRMGRQHTSSPTIISGSSGRQNHPVRRNIDADLRNANHSVPAPPPLPTPPAPSGTDLSRTLLSKASTPPLDRVSPPRLPKSRNRRRPSMGSQQRPAPPDGRRPSDKATTYTLLEGVVPPINVLIVEDNPINMLILEKFARILKVRWQTAMNGRDAVIKWKTGGFHLVLMDIQLPIMSGLEATKEIRRLERVNGIGVFARTEGAGEAPKLSNGTMKEKSLAIDHSDGNAADALDGVDGDDKLSDKIFKSPVIIVALTASSLQSDRHEALAAGCNDFLTKPVSFPWLERKVMEWGCMQALIDFDGWRKWKDMAENEEKEKAAANAKKGPGAKEEEKKAAKAALLARMRQRPPA